MKNKIFFVLFLLTAFGCSLESEIDYKTIYEGDKIIVHGYISPQEGVNVIVKKSVPPNQLENDDRLPDAKVYLYCNDKKIAELTKVDDYNHVLTQNITYKVGDLYHVEVFSPSLNQKAISAKQPILPKPIIDSGYIDTQNWREYYVVYFQSEYKGKIFYQEIFPIHNDTVRINRPYGRFSGGYFTAKKQGTNIFTELLYFSGSQAMFFLYNITDDLAKFISSTLTYEGYHYDPFIENVYPIYSNIKGGYGVFVSYSYDTLRIKKR